MQTSFSNFDKTPAEISLFIDIISPKSEIEYRSGSVLEKLLKLYLRVTFVWIRIYSITEDINIVVITTIYLVMRTYFSITEYRSWKVKCAGDDYRRLSTLCFKVTDAVAVHLRSLWSVCNRNYYG